ncbi:hypothetical protein BJ944DRAFT_160109 [Cunninghamella echinulata]|nr:hypothetical protein BJ944DRAFT_160109 [Cunninghamella echinulata]
MAFKFNFTSEDLDIEEDQDQQLETTLSDLNIQEDTNKIPCQEYNILTSSLPNVIQADILKIPHTDIQLYKRTLADVKFQMAEQDTLEENSNSNNSSKDNSEQILDMLNLTGNSDLIRGVYEGGFKTWECSIDLVQWLSQLPKQDITNKSVLELGCGSALPSLYLLQKELNNQVDVQDYNEQVIRLITLPNILLNTILTPQQSAPLTSTTVVNDDDNDGLSHSSSITDNEKDNENDQDNDSDDNDDEDECEVIDEPLTCDAEAELESEKMPDMLQQISQHSKAFIGDWSGLPNKLSRKYDLLITSETIYAEHSLIDLIHVIQHALKKPNGVGILWCWWRYFTIL